jgi:predicted nucleic acid-binding protein
MPDSPVFLDSNIIIYAYSGTDPDKADIARRVIASGNVIISAQVINEFVSVTHKKLACYSPVVSPIQSNLFQLVST